MLNINSKPTQDFLSIKAIRNDLVIMKDNSYRAVLLTTATNFALKSDDEQIAIISQYQNFLNSLDFSIQIFIQSRRLDINPYLMTIKKLQKNQTNELLKIQTKEYIDFIKTFVENSNIMSKSFFVVIPYYSTVASDSGSFLSNTLPFLKQKDEGKKKMETEEYQAQVEQRIGVVEQGLSRTGIKSSRLGTEELIELYFKIFNPGEQGLPSMDNLQQAKK
ncbi:MAG: TraC family protein [Patescibacteria group bacterium]